MQNQPNNKVLGKRTSKNLKLDNKLQKKLKKHQAPQEEEYPSSDDQSDEIN